MFARVCVYAFRSLHQVASWRFRVAAVGGGERRMQRHVGAAIFTAPQPLPTFLFVIMTDLSTLDVLEP